MYSTKSFFSGLFLKSKHRDYQITKYLNYGFQALQFILFAEVFSPKEYFINTEPFTRDRKTKVCKAFSL